MKIPGSHRFSGWRLSPVTLICLLLPVFLLAARFGHRRLDHYRGLRQVFGSLAREPYRRLATRWSYPRAAAHRPFSALCERTDCRPRVQHADLARLERAGDLRALGTAYALIGESEPALQVLEALPGSADVESDRAVIFHEAGRLPEAFAALDRALRLDPTHPGALWNRAIVMDAAGLPLMAAVNFRAVERLAEKGWADEARHRADVLEVGWRARLAEYDRADAEAEWILTGVLPSAETTRRHPDRARRAFFAAVRAEARSPQMAQALPGIARTLDERGSTTSLGGLVDRPELMRRFLALLQKGTVDAAEEYLRLAQATGDPWLQIRGEQLVGKALSARGDTRAAAAAFTRSLKGCDPSWFPDVCIETKLWLANLLTGQRHLQEARRWALEARRDSGIWSIPRWEAEANAILATIEDFRERFAMSRAYAQEAAAARNASCEAAMTGRELLAKIAHAEGDDAEARAQLTKVEICAGTVARFRNIGLETLAQLVSDPAAGWPDGLAWLTEALRQHRSDNGSGTDPTLLALLEARAFLGRDRWRARTQLEGLVAELNLRPEPDEIARMVRLQAQSALVSDSARHAEFGAALEELERMQGAPVGRTCTMGVVEEGGRRLYLARRRSGQIVVARTATAPGDRADRAPAPEALVQSLLDCDEIGVIATAPVLGQSRLLPGHLAWAYLREERAGAPVNRPLHRLVIFDAQPPQGLRLDRLAAVPDLAPAAADESVDRIQGPLATPREVMARAASADMIEWHVHGVVDPEVSDAAALVLSPDESGQALLTAHDVLGLRLTRRPGIVLAACRGGLSARYGAYQWSLPLAFLRAGAGWVIASPTPIEDAEAPLFFSQVWRRIVRGARPAAALRDERQTERWRRSYQQWTDDVVLFEARGGGDR